MSRTEEWVNANPDAETRIAWVSITDDETVVCSYELFAQLLRDLGWTMRDFSDGAA